MLSPTEVYYRVLLHLLKWFAVVYGSVATLMTICILIDWFGGAGWGYQWYALPFSLLMIGAAFILRKVAIAMLKVISK